MKNLNLENFGVQELDAKEMANVDGGKVPTWLKKLGWGSVVAGVIDNWDEIKQGLSDGWNGK